MKKESVTTRGITIGEITARVNQLAPNFSKDSLQASSLLFCGRRNCGDFTLIPRLPSKDIAQKNYF